MTTTVRHLWERLSSSYWLVPSVMVALGIALAFRVLRFDRDWNPGAPALDPLYSGSAEGARALLTVIAGSVITVAGVAFSITIATLTQASRQFGPRLLRNFMSDRGNQVVLGTFTATYVYCLLVVRAVRGLDSESFVPHTAVSVGVLLALASIALLIYFIHHISNGLQAPVVTSRTARELDRAVRSTFPAAGAGDGGAAVFEARPRDARPILAPRSGFLQSLDSGRLLAVARDANLRVEMTVRSGHFVVRHHVVAWAWPAGACSREHGAALCKALFIGNHPTAEQDVEYFVQQLVEIAARGLSSQNDPFAAMLCVDWLGAALCEAARRDDPRAVLRDEAGTARVKLDVWSFGGLLDAACDPLRQNARSSVPVMIRLLERLADVALAARNETQRAALRRQLDAIAEALPGMTTAVTDRLDLEQRHRRAARRLERASGPAGLTRPALAGTA